MEQESNKYILNIPHRPNKTAKLIALPMYRYRIQTNEFEYGVNFFQKAVLMLKTKPGLMIRDISAYLGLDERLITIITAELVTMGLIDAHGLLTDKGLAVRKDMDGLIVSENKKEIGYVFQFVNNPGLYSYYVKDVNYVSYIETPQKVKVMTGTKGDSGEEDFYSDAIIPEGLLSHFQNNPAPSEKDVLSVIKKTYKRAKAKDELSEDITSVKGNLSLSFIPNNHPELVWICTYIWLPTIDDGVYDNEWRVLDPFGHGNNIELKLYIDELMRLKMFQNVSELFKDWYTKGNQTFAEFNERVDTAVEEMMSKTFDLGYQKLDTNLLYFMKQVIKNFYLYSLNPSDPNTSDNYTWYIQKALEVIIKIDRERRPNDYVDLSNNYQENEYLTSQYCERERKKKITKLFRERIVVAPTQQGKICHQTKKTSPNRADSLRPLTCMLLLTYSPNKENQLINIIREKLDFIFEFTEDRNDGSHGETSNKRQIKVIPPDIVNRYMSEFQTIVNDFINKYHG